MDLKRVMELYAGGPGSGCNPKVGKCGRKGGGRKNRSLDEVAKQMGDWLWEEQKKAQRKREERKLKGKPRHGGKRN